MSLWNFEDMIVIMTVTFELQFSPNQNRKCEKCNTGHSAAEWAGSTYRKRGQSIDTKKLKMSPESNSEKQSLFSKRMKQGSTTGVALSGGTMAQCRLNVKKLHQQQIKCLDAIYKSGELTHKKS